MNNKIANKGIAITLTTEQDLNALGDAFLGITSGAAPHLVSDDYLVAVLLGWYMRSSKIKSSRTSGYVFTEFAFRRTLAADGTFIDEHSQIRGNSRGTSSTPGNVLTISGIKPETNAEIRHRIEILEQRFTELQQIAEQNENSESDFSTWKFVAGFSDQEIIDIGIWAILKTCVDESTKLELYPSDFENELTTRAGK